MNSHTKTLLSNLFPVRSVDVTEFFFNILVLDIFLSNSGERPSLYTDVACLHPLEAERPKGTLIHKSFEKKLLNTIKYLKEDFLPGDCEVSPYGTLTVSILKKNVS